MTSIMMQPVQPLIYWSMLVAMALRHVRRLNIAIKIRKG